MLARTENTLSLSNLRILESNATRYFDIEKKLKKAMGEQKVPFLLTSSDERPVTAVGISEDALGEIQAKLLEMELHVRGEYNPDTSVTWFLSTLAGVEPHDVASFEVRFADSFNEEIDE